MAESQLSLQHYWVSLMRRPRQLRLNYAAIIICIIWLKIPLMAEEGLPSSATNRPPTIAAVKVAKPPVLDGNLDDPCWQQSPKLTGLVFSDLHRIATEETTAYICYDSQNLYVGFYARDSKPNLIRAEQKKKGGGALNDDLLEITVDTYHTHKDVYYFDVNPIGVTFESIPKGAAAKTEWRGDWQAAAKIVEDGWIAEMAIPFSLFRYQPEETVWSVLFARYLSREKEWSNYPDIGSPANLTRMADWVGLELPVVRHKPLILGYGLATVSDTQILQAGLDVKQVTPGGMTGVLTVNPDFASIEQSVANIDFSYSEKLLSDNRPFFAEGSGYFPSTTYFYTRRIEDIYAGASGFGTIGALSTGAMTVAAKNGDQDSALRVNYDFTPYSAISAIAVGQQSDVDNLSFGSTLSLGRPSGQSGRNTLSFGSYHTRSQDEGGNGDYFSTSVSHSPDSGKLAYSLSYLNVDPNFSPGLGSYPEPDRIGWSGSVSQSQRVADSRFRSYYWSGSAYRYLDHEGGLRYGGTQLSASASFTNNTSLGAGFTYEERPPNIDRVGSLNGSWRTNDPFRSGSMGFRFGKQDGADYLYGSLSQRLRVTDSLHAALSLEHSRLLYPDQLDILSQLVFSSTYDLDPERSLGLRWVQGGDLSNVYLSYRKTALHGTDFYLIFGDPNADKTEMKVTLKVVMPIEIF